MKLTKPLALVAALTAVLRKIERLLGKHRFKFGRLGYIGWGQRIHRRRRQRLCQPLLGSRQESGVEAADRISGTRSLSMAPTTKPTLPAKTISLTRLSYATPQHLHSQHFRLHRTVLGAPAIC